MSEISFRVLFSRKYFPLRYLFCRSLCLGHAQAVLPEVGEVTVTPSHPTLGRQHCGSLEPFHLTGCKGHEGA